MLSHPMQNAVLRCCCIAAILFAAGDSGAWVCSRALSAKKLEAGASLSWFKRDLTFAFHTTGTTDLSGQTEEDVLASAFAVWAGVSSCSAPAEVSDLTFTAEPNRVDKDPVGFNFLNPGANQNLLIFRDTGWIHPDGIIALTTTTYVTQTGEIIDADIEFNSQGFLFGDLEDCCPNCNGNIGDDPDAECLFIDLANTAVHEIGHIVGLGHPDEWPEIDPLCETESTMCSTAQLGDVDKRTLSCDDRDAIVFKYPAGAPNGYALQPVCADGLEACGSCTGPICTAWSALGFCAPPTPLVNDMRIRDVTPIVGSGCVEAHPASGAFLAGLGILIVLSRCRRRA